MRRPLIPMLVGLLLLLVVVPGCAPRPAPAPPQVSAPRVVPPAPPAPSQPDDDVFRFFTPEEKDTCILLSGMRLLIGERDNDTTLAEAQAELRQRLRELIQASDPRVKYVHRLIELAEEVYARPHRWSQDNWERLFRVLCVQPSYNRTPP